jgi:hypothetical protein
MASYDHLLKEKSIEDKFCEDYNACDTWEQQLKVLRAYVQLKIHRNFIGDIARGTGIKRNVIEYLLVGKDGLTAGLHVKYDTYKKIIDYMGFQFKVVELKPKVAIRNKE